MFDTIKEDAIFVIPSTIIWLLSIGITIWDFATKKEMLYHLNTVSIVGIFLRASNDAFVSLLSVVGIVGVCLWCGGWDSNPRIPEE